MKKILITFFFAAIVVIGMWGFGEKNSEDETTTKPTEKQETWIDDSALRVVGGTEDITKVIEDGAVVTSSDTSIVRVNGNSLEMLAKGYVTISCEYQTKIEKYYYVILSKDEYDSYEATFDSNRVIMQINATNTWSVEWSEFTLKVSDPSVVQVTPIKNGFTAKAIGFGGSYIMVTTATGIILNYYVFSFPMHE